MTFDRTSQLSLGFALALHAGLAWGLGSLALQATVEMPLLIEVTLAGSSAPRSTTEGIKAEGQVMAPKGEEGAAPLTAEQVRAWRDQRRREIIQELSRSRSSMDVGADTQQLRKTSEGLAEGRGAGESGRPGSPRGSLSLTGAIATRGFQEPDFSILKNMITEETQLRLLLVVAPGGEVKQASLQETSGYPFVDQKAIEISRKIVFDPLPPDWKQTDQEGILTVKLKL